MVRAAKPSGGMHGCTVLALAAMLAAGCATYRPRPIAPARSLERFEARRLDAPEVGAYLQARNGVTQWPPAHWDLHTMTLVALFYSPELDVARARWAVARGGVLTAGERANPTLNTAIGYNSSTDPAQITPWIPEAALDLPLDIANQRGIRVRQARQLTAAARWNILTAAWQVRSAVRRAFLELYVAHESRSLRTRQREIQSQIVQVLESQAMAGEASPYQVTQARTSLADSRLAALDAAQRETRARAALAEAVGVPLTAFDGITWSFEDLGHSLPRLPTNEIRRRALLNRSDIRASLAEYEASQAALELEIRKQYPDVSLGPGYQLDQTDSKWTLAASVVLPLVNRNQGPIAEARARRREAAARFLSLQSRVLAELDAAIRSAREVAEQVETADAVTASLTTQERIARASYDAGETSRLELLGVQSELVMSALSRLDAVAKAEDAVGALEDAMQSPLDMKRWALRVPPHASHAEHARLRGHP